MSTYVKQNKQSKTFCCICNVGSNNFTIFHPHKFYNSFVPVLFFSVAYLFFTWKRQVLIWQLPFVVFWDLWCWPLAQRHLKNKCRRVGRVGDHVLSRGSELLCPFLTFCQSKIHPVFSILKNSILYNIVCHVLHVYYIKLLLISFACFFFKKRCFLPKHFPFPVSPNCRPLEACDAWLGRALVFLDAMLLMLGGLHEAPPETLGCMWKSFQNYNYDVAGNGEMRIFFFDDC